MLLPTTDYTDDTDYSEPIRAICVIRIIRDPKEKGLTVVGQPHQVEMAGIEPASETLERGYTTSLVAVWCFTLQPTSDGPLWES